MKKLVYSIQKLQVISGGFFLAIFLITVVVQMATRALGITALWTEDVSMYSFIWSVFMGAGAMVLDKRHFAFTAIADSITNEKYKRILSIIIWTFMLLFCLMMFYYGCLITKRFWNYTWIGIPAFKRGPTWLCLPISGAIMVLYALTLLWEDIKALRKEDTSSPGKGKIKVIVIVILFIILAFGYFTGKIPMTVILVAMFILLIGIGVPIAFSLGMVSLIGINSLPLTPNMVVFTKMFNGLNSFTLLAVPLFILAATLMNSGAITDRLIDVCIALVGSFRGGLAHANILISMIFAGISGSSQADTAGIGKILIPAMIEHGYDKETSVGVTAASSTLGSIIPPSILMVVYSGIANVSTGALFLSGLIPGIMLGLAQMGVVVAYGKKKNFPKEKRVPIKIIIRKVLTSLPALLTPVILIGGIIFGFFTPTESAAIASVYALVIGLFFYRTLKFSDLPKILMETMKQSSLSLFALSTATALGELLSYYRANTMVQQFFANITAKTFVFLLITVAFFIFIGTIMDGVPAMILFVPIILPTAVLLHISPLILGLIIVITLALGLVTPPYGLCLLIASSIANISIERAFKGVLPYFLVSLAVLLILIIFPDTFLAIPKNLFPSVF
jgi:tripartite ATP-independent transporter DctM subunit